MFKKRQNLLNFLGWKNAKAAKTKAADGNQKRLQIYNTLHQHFATWFLDNIIE